MEFGEETPDGQAKRNVPRGGLFGLVMLLKIKQQHEAAMQQQQAQDQDQNHLSRGTNHEILEEDSEQTPAEDGNRKVKKAGQILNNSLGVEERDKSPLSLKAAGNQLLSLKR